MKFWSSGYFFFVSFHELRNPNVEDLKIQLVSNVANWSEVEILIFENVYGHYREIPKESNCSSISRDKIEHTSYLGYDSVISSPHDEWAVKV